ncbi:hypothetical protein BDR22DRAFT_699087 [Usnea florida]
MIQKVYNEIPFIVLSPTILSLRLLNQHLNRNAHTLPHRHPILHNLRMRPLNLHESQFPHPPLHLPLQHPHQPLPLLPLHQLIIPTMPHNHRLHPISNPPLTPQNIPPLPPSLFLRSKRPRRKRIIHTPQLRMRVPARREIVYALQRHNTLQPMHSPFFPPNTSFPPALLISLPHPIHPIHPNHRSHSAPNTMSAHNPFPVPHPSIFFLQPPYCVPHVLYRIGPFRVARGVGGRAGVGGVLRVRAEAVVEGGDGRDVRVVEEVGEGGEEGLRGGEGVAEGAAVDVAGGVGLVGWLDVRVRVVGEWGRKGLDTSESRMGRGGCGLGCERRGC